MCGRTVCHRAPSCICQAVGKRTENGKWSQPVWRDPPAGQKYYPSYNQAPTSYTPILLSKKHLTGEELTSCVDLTDTENAPAVPTEGTDYVVQPMHWGLVPSWHQGDPKTVGLNLINARSDSMLNKRTFSAPLSKGRRCVALIDGYYEWQTNGKEKQPYYIYKSGEVKDEVKTENQDAKVKDEIKTEAQDIKIKEEIKVEGGKPMLMVAGLFDIWRSNEGEPLYSFSMITVDAHKDMSWIHHRMPAILRDEDEVRMWLDFSEVPLKKAVEVIRPVTDLQSHPVDKAVGNVKNKSPTLITPVDINKPQIKNTGSSNFMAAWLKRSAPVTEKRESTRKRSVSESDKVTVKPEVVVKSEVKEEGDEPSPCKHPKMK